MVKMTILQLLLVLVLAGVQGMLVLDWFKTKQQLRVKK